MKTIILAAALAISACAAPRPGSGASGALAPADSIVLERTRCFGFCPSYRLSLTSAGRVSFVSRNPGDNKPESISTIPVSRFASLARELEMLPLSAFPETLNGDPTYCPHIATDNPSAIVTLFFGGGSKTVNDYHGCRGSGDATEAALERLRLLEARIDTVAGSSRWITPPRTR